MVETFIAFESSILAYHIVEIINPIAIFILTIGLLEPIGQVYPCCSDDICRVVFGRYKLGCWEHGIIYGISTSEYTNLWMYFKNFPFNSSPSRIIL